MPRATGTSTTANTCRVLPNCSPRLPPSAGSKQAIARFVITGRVTTATSEFTAVSVMLRATSPRNRWLNRLAVVPPGEAASSSRPTASSGGRSKASTRPKQIAGRTSSCRARAMTTALGCRPTRAKSATVSDRPSPNMTRASASGSRTVVSAESMRPSGQATEGRAGRPTGRDLHRGACASRFRSAAHARVNERVGSAVRRRGPRGRSAPGRGRLGALGAEKPDRLCAPSQNGLMPDLPHRHSAMVSPAGVDLGAVLVDQPEVAAHDQRAVAVGRDGGAGALRAARSAPPRPRGPAGRRARSDRGLATPPPCPAPPPGTRRPRRTPGRVTGSRAGCARSGDRRPRRPARGAVHPRPPARPAAAARRSRRRSRPPPRPARAARRWPGRRRPRAPHR